MDAKAAAKLYRQRMAAADSVVLEAMLEVYAEVTGKTPTDGFREQIENAIVAWDQ